MTEFSGSLLLYLFTAASLVAVGVYGFITGPEMLRRILALNIFSAGVFMLMVVLAYRTVALKATTSDAATLADPVLHALVLTGLVVAVSASAFALALLARLKQPGSKQEPE